MFSTRKLGQTGQGSADAEAPNLKRPFTAKKLRLCARETPLRSAGGSFGGRDISVRAVPGTSLVRSPEIFPSEPNGIITVITPSVRIQVQTEPKVHQQRQTLSPSPPGEILCATHTPQSCSQFAVSPAAAGGHKKKVSHFESFVQRASATASERCNDYATLRPQQRHRLLKSISNAAELRKAGVQPTPGDLARWKLAASKGSGTAEEMQRTEDGTKSYTHGMYRPVPLLSSETLMKRIQEKNDFAERIREILAPHDQELFDLMEECRTEMLKHSEWFADSVGQKNMYLNLTNIEDRWLQPSESAYLQLLAEEKRRVEQELKQKAAAETAK